jgi:hypothetical protein
MAKTLKDETFPAKAGRARASRYQALLKGKDMAVSKRYSSKDEYLLGDLIEHPNFGIGIATDIKNEAKMEVLFEGGSKVLIHSR